MQNWERLDCSACGGGDFQKVIHIKVHPTGGSTEEHGGHKCADCGTKVDIAMLKRAADLKRKKAELADLEDQINQETARTKPG